MSEFELIERGLGKGLTVTTYRDSEDDDIIIEYRENGYKIPYRPTKYVDEEGLKQFEEQIKSDPVTYIKKQQGTTEDGYVETVEADGQLKSKTEVNYEYVTVEGEKYIKETSRHFKPDVKGELYLVKDEFILKTYKLDPVTLSPTTLLSISKEYIRGTDGELLPYNEFKYTGDPKFIAIAQKEDEFKGGILESDKHWREDVNGQRQVSYSKKTLRNGMSIETSNGFELSYMSNRYKPEHKKHPRFRLTSKNYTIEQQHDSDKVILTQGDRKIELDINLDPHNNFILQSPEITETDEKGVEKKLYIDKHFLGILSDTYDRIASEGDVVKHGYRYLDKFLDKIDSDISIFKTRSEKFPDGTYHKFDDYGVLIESDKSIESRVAALHKALNIDKASEKSDNKVANSAPSQVVDLAIKKSIDNFNTSKR